MTQLQITVIGSINLDIVAQAQTLPSPGETITDARLAQHPGGKGANQALAARRLGANVCLVGRVGNDSNAAVATRLLREDGVDLNHCTIDPKRPTGVALIAVDASGENQIIVAPGANTSLTPEHVTFPASDAVICQLETPIPSILKAARGDDCFVAVNLAPAKPVPDSVFEQADLVIVNETEAAFYGVDQLAKARDLVAITYGAKGAALRRNGSEVARATPPPVTAIDATGAGDSFVAALTLALVRGDSEQDALNFACCVGALTATQAGAQPSLPRLADVVRLLT
jgi:ribokinase